ncbi:MAG TPA: hypothetical protein VFM82_04270 [Flavobacteriaceae bacterium]|nr:hypothetical protein [Flavobacteriaceae bacterium]
MALIIFSWIYIFISAHLFGTFVNHSFKLKNGLVVTQFLGFFLITLFTSLYGIFSGINSLFHVILFLINIGFALYLKDILLEYIGIWKQRINDLSTFIKIAFFIITFLIVAKCATAPYLIDNEFYYLQTIKWLNEYGFVKGLANIHFFLGQTSGWHILQSVFNFEFLYDRFNDLSGYCLWLGNIFALQRLNQFFKKEKTGRKLLIFGLFPLANVLYFQFISAPSSDIPVITISFIIFWLLLKGNKNPDRSTFITIYLLCFFTLYIKVSTLFLVLIPLFLLIKTYKYCTKILYPIILFGFCTLVLLVIKNQVLTGYPFYPLQVFQIVKADYALPESIQDLFFRYSKVYAYFITFEEYQHMSMLQRFLTWLQLPKLNGLFNKLIMVLFLLIPFVIQKFRNRKILYFIYFLGIFQLIILFLTSPQYRFFLVFVLFFLNLATASIFAKKKIIKTILIASVVISGIPIFLPINLNSFTKDRFAMPLTTFEFSYLLLPHGNSKTYSNYKIQKEGNLKYFSPVSSDNIWITGDGPLPTINSEQIKFFKENFGIVPQLRTDALEDGFYSKKVNWK